MKRKIVSNLMLISFILLIISAVKTHLTHNEIEHTWLHIHFLFGVIMVGCGIFHLLLNWGAKEIPKLLLISFILLPVSAVATHLTHNNIGGHPWLHIHVVFGIIFVYYGFAHIIKKRKALKFYIFGKEKKENIQQNN